MDTFYEFLIPKNSPSPPVEYELHKFTVLGFSNGSIKMEKAFVKMMRWEEIAELLFGKSKQKSMSHEQEQTTQMTPIAYAIGLGNQYRKWLHDDLSSRRDLISGTQLDTPQYQAMLNCMEADLLTALATVIQDYIDRMTNELELERQRKKMDDSYYSISDTPILESI